MHFPLVMTIASISFGVSKANSTKKKIFLFAVTYFLTVAAFSLIIEYLIKTKENYGYFLYAESGADKIFLSCLAIGLIFLFMLFSTERKFTSLDK
jgi:hypothetical protein